MPDYFSRVYDELVLPIYRAGLSAPVSMDNNGRQYVNEDRLTSGRGRQSAGRLLAGTNSTLMYSGQFYLDLLVFGMFGAANGYLRIYDTAVAPVAGAGTPVQQFTVPGPGTWVVPYPRGLYFSVGIGYTCTLGNLDADATPLAGPASGTVSMVAHSGVVAG